MNLLPIFREGASRCSGKDLEAGGGVHEGLVDRFFNELAVSVQAIPDAPVFGLGLGLGTNAGAGLVSGERGFLISEGEWGRVILESGPFLGVAYIALRFAILWQLSVVSFKSLRQGFILCLCCS